MALCKIKLIRTDYFIVTKFVLLVALFIIPACAPKGSPYVWQLPPDFKPPLVPEHNPMTNEKVELGRHLFYEKDLSANQTQACSSCHHQSLAFSDGLTQPLGSTGEKLRRNSPSLVNVAYQASLTWAHPHLKELERQILIPLFSDAPVEMQAFGNEELILNRLLQKSPYPELYAAAFPNYRDPINFDNTVKALASFVRSLVSFNSRFDRYAWYGEDDALDEKELRGLALFMSEKLECRHCHGGFNFSLSNTHVNPAEDSEQFHDIGLYNPQGPKAPQDFDWGVYEINGNQQDRGKFRPPSLRNVALTAPYMHDGSIKTLEELVDFYAAGGRVIENGPYAGDGRLSANKNAFIHGFEISEQEKQELIAFLESLTDESVLSDKRFSDPKSASDNSH